MAQRLNMAKKVDQDGHGRHGHRRILLSDAGALSVSGLKVFNHQHEVGICNSRRRCVGSYHDHAGHDHPDPLFLPYWAAGPSTLTLRTNVQPAALYCRLSTWAILGQPAGHSGSGMVRFVYPNRA